MLPVLTKAFAFVALVWACATAHARTIQSPNHNDAARGGDHIVSQNTTLFDLINMIEFVNHGKGFTVDLSNMDLEAEMTTYEQLLSDSLFEQITNLPPNSIKLFQSENVMETPQAFEEPGMSRDMLKQAPFQCFPPMRGFSEAIETFHMYAGGKSQITPRLLQAAYKKAFGIDLSHQISVAMIRGLVYNTRDEGAPAAVGKCEFVKGYLEQRKILDFRLLSDIDPSFEMKPWWSVSRVVAAAHGSLPESWMNYLDAIYTLDRASGEPHMSKCEVALLMASCRTYVANHYLSFQIPDSNLERASRHPWDLFDMSRVFPVTQEQARLKKDHMGKLLGDLFAVHDSSGNGLLDRDEFSSLMKTIEGWNDAAVFQAAVQKSLEQQEDQSGADGASGGQAGTESQLIKKIDIDTLRFENLLGKQQGKMIKAWQAIKDSKTNVLTKKKLVHLLKATNRVPENKLEEEANKLMLVHSHTHETSKVGLTKNEFMKAILNPQDSTRLFRTAELRVASGYIAGYKYENEKTADRTEEHGRPVSNSADRNMFAILAPMMRAFEALCKPGTPDREGLLTFEDFSNIKNVLPRLKRAHVLRNEEKMQQTFEKYLSMGRSKMDLADFALMFAVPESDIDDSATDNMPFITLKSFVWVPRLKLPKEAKALLESDLLDQANYQSYMMAQVSDVKEK